MLCCPSFLFISSRPPLGLHSFPTRRSSDLCGSGASVSSIVSMSAIWSPPEEETVQSSSSAAIDEREISVRLSSSSASVRSEEHTSELQSLTNLVCRLLLEKKKKKQYTAPRI